MATMTRKAYAEMFGPTTGDCVRLGDTSLLAQIEHDYTRYGDECMAGGGKTLRDGMAISTRTNQDGALDLLVQNAVVIDPVIGIVKGDIGVKDGKIVGIGKAGNPAIMEGVDERLVVGNATAVEAGSPMSSKPRPRYSTSRFGSSAAPVIFSRVVAVSFEGTSENTVARSNQCSGKLRRRPLSLVSPRRYV